MAAKRMPAKPYELARGTMLYKVKPCRIESERLL
jgi:hypothetical protein